MKTPTAEQVANLESRLREETEVRRRTEDRLAVAIEEIQKLRKASLFYQAECARLQRPTAPLDETHADPTQDPVGQKRMNDYEAENRRLGRED